MIIMPPEYSTDSHTPAYYLAKTRAIELGLTIPYLNGIAMLGARGISGAIGTGSTPHVDAKLNEPMISIVDTQVHREVFYGRVYSQQPYVNQYPPVKVPKVSWDLFGGDDFGEEVGEFEMEQDPRDQKAQAKHERKRFRGKMLNHPENLFTWKITLPPDCDWIEKDVPVDTIATIMQKINEQAPQGLQKRLPASDRIRRKAKWELKILPSDGRGRLLKHTLAHENQHYKDHVAIVNTIYKPWDDIFTRVYTRQRLGKLIGRSTRGEVMTFFSTAGNYTPSGAQRVVTEMVGQFEKSGKHFHDNTEEGSYPVMWVEEVTEGRLTLGMRAAKLLDGGTYLRSPQEGPRALWDGTLYRINH